LAKILLLGKGAGGQYDQTLVVESNLNFIEAKSKQAEEGEADDAEEETTENNEDPDKQFQIFLSQHRLW
jgi:hypothetical protein